MKTPSLVIRRDVPPLRSTETVGAFFAVLRVVSPGFFEPWAVCRDPVGVGDRMQIQARHIETVACRAADTDLSLPDGNGRQLASLRGFIGPESRIVRRSFQACKEQSDHPTGSAWPDAVT